MSLYITGLVVGMGLGLMIAGIGLLMFMEYSD